MPKDKAVSMSEYIAMLFGSSGENRLQNFSHSTGFDSLPVSYRSDGRIISINANYYKKIGIKFHIPKRCLQSFSGFSPL